MKLKRRIAMMLTVLCLMLSMSTVSYAAEAEGDDAVRVSAAGEAGGIQPYYINTSNISAGIRIEGNTVYCRAEVFAKQVCFVNVRMRLQRNVNGIWQTKVSWIESSTSGGKTMSKSFTLSERGTYRVYVLANVDGEEVTCTSVTATY